MGSTSSCSWRRRCRSRGRWARPSTRRPSSSSSSSRSRVTSARCSRSRSPPHPALSPSAGERASQRAPPSPSRGLAGVAAFRVPFATTRTREEDPMPVTELNHYFVRANDLERTKDFYCDVLGFSVMPRPSFPFPGYWLGVNGKIQVHMGQDGIDNAELYYLGTPKGAVTDHAGVVD